MKMERRNQMRSMIFAVLGLGFMLAASTARAVLTEEEIARLGGPELTPVGAQRAGNADGTIPEWKGGVTAPPPGWQPGQERIDTFADDKILFTIDASNVDKYADKLSPGQVALIKSYEGYKMNVYPTRRSCAYPSERYEEIKRNARIAKVDDECLLLEGTHPPLFPIPKTGCELIQNGKLCVFNAIEGMERLEATLIPTKGGSFEPIIRTMKATFRGESMRFPTFASLDGVWTKYLTNNQAPPKQAGEITLVYALTDGHLKAWTYNPGQRRVRRNPNFEYDNPVPGFQGLMMIDQNNGYVGAPDRYNWKLIGKQELYIPYNNVKFFDTHIKYAELLQPRYPKRDLIRYELHRVWVMEATVRPDQRHTMARRVFYLDEDSWLITVVDGYDARGSMWRVSEHVPEVLYEIPSCVANSSIYYDLVAGRYIVSPASNEEKEADYLAGRKGLITEEGFTPDDLRRLGMR
jgi:hypothetical protein